MKELSAKRAADRPCKDEARNSMLCQIENETQRERCQAQMEAYRECMQTYVCFCFVLTSIHDFDRVWKGGNVL